MKNLIFVAYNPSYEITHTLFRAFCVFLAINVGFYVYQFLTFEGANPVEHYVRSSSSSLLFSISGLILWLLLEAFVNKTAFDLKKLPISKGAADNKLYQGEIKSFLLTKSGYFNVIAKDLGIAALAILAAVYIPEIAYNKLSSEFYSSFIDFSGQGVEQALLWGLATLMVQQVFIAIFIIQTLYLLLLLCNKQEAFRVLGIREKE